MKSGKKIWGILAASTIGALTGILFAPDKGVNTRKKIAEKGKDYSAVLKDEYQKSLYNLTKAFKKGKTEVSYTPKKSPKKDQP